MAITEVKIILTKRDRYKEYKHKIYVSLWSNFPL